MNDFLVALISGVVLILMVWGSWKFLNSISPVDDEDD